MWETPVRVKVSLSDSAVLDSILSLSLSLSLSPISSAFADVAKALCRAIHHRRDPLIP